MKPLLVLQVHCRYRSGPGGEDTVVEEERRLLTAHGHAVVQFFGDNAGIAGANPFRMAAAGIASIWNSRAAKRLRARIADLRPDVVHVHNTFAALSPSIFWAASDAGIPVVLTLHNYRLACANGILFRDGAPCTDCIERTPLTGLRRRCRYNGSLCAGASVILTRIVHSALGTYRSKVDAFVALTDFQRELIVRMGLPANRVFVKPNVACDPTLTPCNAAVRRRSIVYLGNTSAFKGLDLLLAAWAKGRRRGYQLEVIGDGPEARELRQRFAACADVVWLGRLARADAVARLRMARWLAIPSRCFEGFPMALAEGFALGTPPLAPAHGCFPSIVRDGQSGILFSPDEDGLSRQLDRALAIDDREWQRYSEAARRDHETRFAVQENYRKLMSIYQKVMSKEQGCVI